MTPSGQALVGLFLSSCVVVCVLQVVLLSSKMGSQGAKDIPAGGGLVRALSASP